MTTLMLPSACPRLASMSRARLAYVCIAAYMPLVNTPKKTCSHAVALVVATHAFC